MIPWELLDRTTTPDGSEMTLHRRGDELVIRVDREDLMSSRMHGSEEMLADLGCAVARRKSTASVLVGGLGMGFTLRATLDRMPDGAEVHVAELVPSVVTWNRGVLGPLAGHPLEDPRVVVHEGDVGALLRSSRERFDAILLDVDNGPIAMTMRDNAGLYTQRGLQEARAALRNNGVYALWSASPNDAFTRRLEASGFRAESIGVRARGTKGGPRHTIWVAHRT